MGGKYYYYYFVFSVGEAACPRAHTADRSRTEEVEVGGGLPPSRGRSPTGGGSASPAPRRAKPRRARNGGAPRGKGGGRGRWPGPGYPPGAPDGPGPPLRAVRAVGRVRSPASLPGRPPKLRGTLRAEAPQELRGARCHRRVEVCNQGRELRSKMTRKDPKGTSVGEVSCPGDDAPVIQERQRPSELVGNRPAT